MQTKVAAAEVIREDEMMFLAQPARKRRTEWRWRIRKAHGVVTKAAGVVVFGIPVRAQIPFVTAAPFRRSAPCRKVVTGVFADLNASCSPRRSRDPDACRRGWPRSFESRVRRTHGERGGADGMARCFSWLTFEASEMPVSGLTRRGEQPTRRHRQQRRGAYELACGP